MQDELIDIIKSNKSVNDYELIVYKYIFISELEIPLLEDFGFELIDDGFILYIIPDGLKFEVLSKLNKVFDKFELIFMPNSLNVIKIKFMLCD